MALVVPGRDELKGKTKQPTNRLAVLPFVNMSADPENEYFSDGITEELLNALDKSRWPAGNFPHFGFCI